MLKRKVVLTVVLYLDRIEVWISEGDVYVLTGLMFLLIFFVATQDIAVDGTIISRVMHISRRTFVFISIVVSSLPSGNPVYAGWALTMLSPANRGFGSTCQAVGMNLGYFLSYTIFLALSSAKFCNSYLRSVPGTFYFSQF